MLGVTFLPPIQSPLPPVPLSTTPKSLIMPGRFPTNSQLSTIQNPDSGFKRDFDYVWRFNQAVDIASRISIIKRFPPLVYLEVNLSSSTRFPPPNIHIPSLAIEACSPHGLQRDDSQGQSGRGSIFRGQTISPRRLRPPEGTKRVLLLHRNPRWTGNFLRHGIYHFRQRDHRLTIWRHLCLFTG